MKDARVAKVPIGCGKCMECLKQKANNWKVRLSEEIRDDQSGVFVTLTFSNESIRKLVRKIDDKIKGYDRDNEIATKAVRLFLERWRKHKKKSVKHWLITELGHQGTENIHLHGIIFGKRKDIEKHWQYGYIFLGDYVNEKTINYMTKYVMKTDLDHKYYVPKILCSPGIGKKYLERYDSKLNKFNTLEGATNEIYKTRAGHKIALPIYYRNHIYSDDEKEQLWLEKLNKNERYILGNKIDISENYQEYYEVLQEARRTNKKLGYGDDEKNWDRIIYENARRDLMIKKRLLTEGIYYDEETGEILNE